MNEEIKTTIFSDLNAENGRLEPDYAVGACMLDRA